jgi:hypothetical protein
MTDVLMRRKLTRLMSTVVADVLIWRLQWPRRRGRARSIDGCVGNKHRGGHLAQSLSVPVAVVIVAARATERLVLAGVSMFALVMRLLLLVVASGMSVLGPGPVWGPKLASLATKMTTGKEAATAIVMAIAKCSIANVVMAVVVVAAAIDTKDTGGSAAGSAG